MSSSYFDHQQLKAKIERVKEKDICPKWFPEALSLLLIISDDIPVEDDEDRYIIEFIYPH